jgi:hypothetical protein
MSKDCNFKVASAELYENEYTRDAFIRGLRCLHIRQRLLENKGYLKTQQSLYNPLFMKPELWNWLSYIQLLTCLH